MPKLQLSVQRMLALMEYVIANKLRDIDSKGAFFKSIGMSNASNLNKIIAGTQAFGPEHYVNACEYYGVDGNYFLDKKHFIMFMGILNIAIRPAISNGMRS